MAAPEAERLEGPALARSSPFLANHPCYSRAAHRRYARIHLPVAERCNLGCRYCERRIGGLTYHAYRPAVAARVVRPEEAVELVARHLPEGNLTVAGVAGPGEPLCNPETFETLRLVGARFPELILCLSTNGLLLADRAEELYALGVRTLTVTLNTVDPALGERIYSCVMAGNQVLVGREGAAALLARQLEGIGRAAALGMAVKINSILIPGVNADGHLQQVARAARAVGAWVQNITPLIPLGRFRDLQPPSRAQLQRTRARCEQIIPQFRLCRQCPADAVGVPGRETRAAHLPQACLLRGHGEGTRGPGRHRSPACAPGR
jgi:nitrogen fixation protein NifB